MPRNQTSFKKGHRRSAESIEKQRETLKAKGIQPTRPVWTPERIAKREATRKQRHPPKGRLQNGYRQVRVDGCYRYEHRVVMERELGRSLLVAEHVHHINGDKLDNRLENLQIMNVADHNTHHHTGRPSVNKGKGSMLGGKWSRKYEACVRCGRTSQAHAAKGFCRSCHSARY